MRIYDGSLTGTAGETARAAEIQRSERESSSRTGGSSSGSGDRVELSNALGSLSRALNSYGSGRAAHVEALAAQYQSGQYRPDPAATSRGMVAEALAGGAQ